MAILVTGGAGYIGSHTSELLLSRGQDVVIVDDLSNSDASVIGRIEKLAGKAPVFCRADARDASVLSDVFRRHDIDAVIHFAGLKAVGESVERPLSYYRSNIDLLLTVLETMARHSCRRIVFSSSATVYGPNNPVPYTEDMETSAVNPYGWTKVMAERILKDAVSADSGLRAISLRYFNPIGAHESGLLGEQPSGHPNNLMPNITAAAAGRIDKLRIFGKDYDTPDGTGVRDYIHVCDLAEGHISALEYLENSGGYSEINLGTGKGTSVLQLVRTFEEVTGQRVPFEFCQRRPGDLAECYASADRAKALLGFEAKRTVEDMCRDAWRWEMTMKNGLWATE